MISPANQGCAFAYRAAFCTPLVAVELGTPRFITLYGMENRGL